MRRAARREAWYTNPDEGNLIYDAFRRLNAHHQARRVANVEEASGDGLQHIATETHDPIEIARRGAWYHYDDVGYGGYRGPKKSSTFSAEVDQSKSHSEPEDQSGIETKDHVVSGTSQSGVPPVQLETPLESATVPKPRMRRQFMPWKKDSSEELTEEEPSKPTTRLSPITLLGQIKAIFGSWMNVLLAFVPAGFAVYYTRQDPTTVFIVNFFAIIPTSALLSYSIDELALYIGDTLQGLLTITFR